VVQAVTAPVRVTPYSAILGGSVYGGVSGSTVTGTTAETVLNQSASPVTIGTVTATTNTGPGPGPNFAIASDMCSGAMLTPSGMTGDSCTFYISFTASAVGTFTGTASVPYTGAPNSPQVVNLSGTGVKGSFTQSSAIAFPNTQVGTTSSTTGTETVTNNSSVPLVINAIPTPTGPTGVFGVLSMFGTNPCNISGTTTLAPNGMTGASCTAGVTFSPNAQGAFTGTLGVTSAYANGTAATKLSGSGILAGVTFSPGAIQFGGVPTGTTSADVIETVTNPNMSVMGSNTNVVVSGITTTSTPSGAFNIDPASTTCGTSPSYAVTLAPGASCSVAINFSPTTAVTYSGTLNVSDNAGNGTQKATLYGTGK
jgi:trimeric autotransporter adhesin